MEGRGRAPRVQSGGDGWSRGGIDGWMPQGRVEAAAGDVKGQERTNERRRRCSRSRVAGPLRSETTLPPWLLPNPDQAEAELAISTFVVFSFTGATRKCLHTGVNAAPL
jgi:hypothetical protein